MPVSYPLRNGKCLGIPLTCVGHPLLILSQCSIGLLVSHRSIGLLVRHRCIVVSAALNITLACHFYTSLTIIPFPRHSSVSSLTIPLFDPLTSGGSQTSTVLFTGQDTAKRGERYVVQPSRRLPLKLSRRILDLEFVKMSDLLPDSWQEEAQTLVVFNT